jgi:TPR repeat protein
VENGDKEAIVSLGVCYEKGVGTEKNLEKAFYWYQKAAENGDDEAILNLNKVYTYYLMKFLIVNINIFQLA